MTAIFPRKFRCFALWLVFGLQAGFAAAPGLQPDEVRSLILSYWQTLSEGPYAKSDAFIEDGKHLASAALAAAMEVRAAEWSGDKSPFKAAAERLKLVARRGLQTDEADFFTSFPFSWAYSRVAAAGMADAELTDLAKNYAESKFKPRDEGLVFNQTFIRACGLAMAAKNWPQSPKAAVWLKYANAMFDDFLKLQDAPENSTDYNAFDLLCPFLLADLLGRTEELRGDGIKRYYERFVAQTSPAGFIPPYGDAGTPPKAFTPDWPIQNPWGFYVSAFERAGAFWSDPQFRWASARMLEAGQKYQKLTRDYTDLQELFYFSFAPDWMNPALASQLPPIHSQVLTRTDKQGPGQLDKLLLASSHAPGSPYLLADLYARGAHAHENQPGAIVYYEYDNQALLAALGYNSRNPEYANLTVLGADGAGFPFTDGLFEPGVWHEAQLPTSRLPVLSSDAPNLRHIKDVVFRVGAGKQGVEVAISRMELLGSNGQVLPVEAMDDPSLWKGPANLTATRENDSAKLAALAWKVPEGVTFLNRNNVDLDFDCLKYPLLRFRWKLSNNDERARPLILRLGPGLDYKVCIPQLSPQLASAQAGEREGVQLGVMNYTGWFTPKSRLTRQIAVFPDGMLIVHDLLIPGDDAANQRAGQIWHFLPLVQPEAGSNWFNTTGGKCDLLVFFNPAPNRTYSASTIEVWNKATQQSICASEAVQPGQALSFTAVLIPHPHAISAASVASQIQAADQDGVTRVQIKGAEGMRSIEFGNGLNWKIQTH